MIGRFIGLLLAWGWVSCGVAMELPVVPGAAVEGNKPLMIQPSAGTWDFSAHDSIEFKLTNLGTSRATVWARAENPDAKGVMDNVRTAVVLNGGETKTLRLRLMRRPESPGYAPFKPFLMYFKDLNVRDNTVDVSKIAQLVVWLEHPEPKQKVLVESAAATGEGKPGSPPFLPFIDKYGQYKHTDWPDKIYSDADFADCLKKDDAEMAAHPGPADWNQYGGRKDGPKQKATGYFYPAKIDGMWWLVDPEGCLFWSYGPTGVNSGGETSPVTDKESWFEEIPSRETFARYWEDGQGARFMYYQDGKPWKAFSFSGLNAERKYGPNWREATADALHRRLRNWGLNTMGNWSDPVVYLKRKTPYTVPIRSGGPMLDHIPDVFDEAWVKSINAAMDDQKNTTANDPWNIGYFVDNEWTWGAQPRAARVVQGILKAPATSVSKQMFLSDLKRKYETIESLNKSWGGKYASWEAMLNDRALPEPQNDSFKQDAGDFGEKFARTYFSTVRDAVKRVAPNNLYLGVRFHGHIDQSLIRIASEYCDVISYNVYEEPAGRLNQYRNVVDKPFIVGEFGVTSDLGQTPWRGQIYTQEQGERLKPLEKWLDQGIRHPALVGAHFFQFRDQPLSGRADGEATLRGFINVADTPHFDLVQTNRRIAYSLYKTRTERRKGG